ncbi:hypothetical protein [Paenibacillus sp. AGC30]
MHSKILVDATDLVKWADRRDSQALLPMLIRNLILSSSDNIDKISFAAGEGVSLGGWDGVTVAQDGDSFLPKGTTVWEMGVSRGVKVKADTDYEKRSTDPLFMSPNETTYIFITLRRWRDKDKWTEGRKKEGIWKDIQVYDADDLETWLSQNPTVHVWLSMHLGKHPQNCIDLSNYWIDWSEETQPTIPPEMVLAGRESIKEEISEWLRNANSPLTIQAETRDEAIAVFAASISLLSPLDRDFNLSKAIVVNNSEAWTYLSSSQNNLILIPSFDSEGLSRAIRNGHHVMIPLGRSDSTTKDTKQIPRLSRERVTSILIDKGLNEQLSRELGLLARRGLTTFRRRTALSPEIRQPLWALPGEARSLVPLLLAGGWSDTKDGDQESLNELAQCSYDKLNELLFRWENESDPPIRRINHAWYIISKEDAWSLLRRYVTLADLEKFRSVALKVLGATDPKLELPFEKQWMAEVLGYTSNYSGIFIRNIADTLAFMGSKEDWASPALSLRVHASNIIYELFSSSKGNFQVWSSLCSVLPLLAEAAPDQFLQALEGEITNEEVILKLFNDQQDPMFVSSPHTGLLWALETIAWNPEYLRRASLLLAKLGRIDPGGKLQNRPINSLREIFLTWNPQTAASIDQRIDVLRILVQREPDVTWELLCILLPQYHGISHSTAKPKWRDWAPDHKRNIIRSEYNKMTHELIQILLTEVGNSGVRWNQIIQSLPMLPLEDLEVVLNELNILGDTDLNAEDKALIWNSLRKELSKHRSFPDADWALSKCEVDRLEEIFGKFEPVDTSALYSWLFSNSPELPEGREGDWEERDHKLNQVRINALSSIYARGGIEEIVFLLDNVEQPYQLGTALGEIRLIVKEEDEILQKYLASTDNNYAQFARGYIFGSTKCLGPNWVFEKLEIASDWGTNKQAEILIFLPANKSTWSLLVEMGDNVERRYWSIVSPLSIEVEDLETAVDMYLHFELPFSAIDLLALRKSCAKPNQIVEALTKLLGVSNIGHLQSHSSPYQISELLSTLENCKEIDDGIIASLEWAYLPILERFNHAPKFLHRELSRNPDFFVEVLSLVYNAEDGESKEVSSEDRRRASQGEDLLKSWRTLPGSRGDNSINKQELLDWVSNSLQATLDSGRGEYGAMYIGEVLSASILGEDGGWPHEAVRDVIEQFSDINIESAFTREVYNSRDFVTKQVYEGGLQEMKLADRYNEYARISGVRWPRTTAILRSIADRYIREAQHEDMSAELREDLG